MADGGTANEQTTWEARRGLAALVRLVAMAFPIVSGAAAAIAVNDLLAPARTVGPAILRSLVVVAVSTVTVLAVDRWARRLLPLATLLNLSLVFPDQAPARFRMALRAGSSRRLAEVAAQAREHGLATDPSLAAEQVLMLIRTIGDHDRRTRGHSERVRLFADLIGEEMGLSSRDRQLLQWSALIHDLGKLSVPPEILNKKGRPDADEWAILQGHPAAGERLIAPLRPLLGDWADAAGGHHEKWDGSGYPRGLAGAQIGRAAAIVAVADSFEVMTAIRSYKKAMSMEAARAELTRCAGTHFSPEVVRSFLSISIRRLRVSMGPLSALAHLPFLGSLTELPGAVSGTIGAATARAAATVPGLLAGVTAGTLVVTTTVPSRVESARMEVVSTTATAGDPTAGGTRALGASSGNGSNGSAVGVGAEDGDDAGSGTVPSSPGGSSVDSGSTTPGGTGDTGGTDDGGSAGGDTGSGGSGGGSGGSTPTGGSTSPGGSTGGTAPKGGGSATTTTAPPPSGSSGTGTTTTARATTTAPTTTAAPPAPLLGLVGDLPLMVSTQSNRANAVPLAGATLTAGSTVYVFVQGLTVSVTGVDFWLGSSTAGPSYSSDLLAPYDLAGSVLLGGAKPYRVPSTPGVHWVSAAAMLLSVQVQTGSAPFLVV